MEILLISLIISGAILVGAISPGPTFVLIARTAVATSRRDAISASIGIGLGGIIFSLLALMGIHVLLTNIPILYLVFKIAGGLYLIYIAYLIWSSSSQELLIEKQNIDKKATLKKSFLLGFFTQLSNPKAALAYSGIFAALLPSNLPNSIYFILPPLIFLTETGWYLVVTFVLSSSKPRGVYLKSKSFIDKTTAFVMGALGTKLLLSASEN